MRVVNVQPRRTVAEQDEDHGKDLFARDPNLCCALRKVEPLGRSLENYELWFTGVRRDEAVTRTATPVIAWDAKNGLIKVSPLAAWTLRPDSRLRVGFLSAGEPADGRRLSVDRMRALHVARRTR